MDSKTISGIEIKNLYKIFGNNPQAMIDIVNNGVDKDTLQNEHQHILALNNINLKIEPGQIQVVMGLSGSGKSTLIRHINRLISPTTGSVLIDDFDVCGLNEKELRNFRQNYTAMVFQNFALLPHYSIQKNVEFGLAIRHIDEKTTKESSHYWIEKVGLAGYEKYFPRELSGGMQQRVGLARALADNAPILLMDEAFSALDPLIRTEMQGILLDLQQELNKTIIFITHDLEEALRIGDNIAILRDGKLIQQGTPQDIVLKPADEYITKFISDVNRGRVIRARVLVEPTIIEDDSLPTITVETTIEEAARIISHAKKQLAHVENKRGKKIGSIKLGRIIRMMLPPLEEDDENIVV